VGLLAVGLNHRNLRIAPVDGPKAWRELDLARQAGLGASRTRHHSSLAMPTISRRASKANREGSREITPPPDQPNFTGMAVSIQ
jgi:hypothetical protein